MSTVKLHVQASKHARSCPSHGLHDLRYCLASPSIPPVLKTLGPNIGSVPRCSMGWGRPPHLTTLADILECCNASQPSAARLIFGSKTQLCDHRGCNLGGLTTLADVLDCCKSGGSDPPLVQQCGTCFANYVGFLSQGVNRGNVIHTL